MSELLAAFGHLRTTTPHRILIHHPVDGEQVDADAVWQLHLALAQQLQAAGLRPGQAVIAATGNRPAFVALVLACRTVPLTLVPVDASAPMPELLDLAERLGAAAMIVPDHDRLSLPSTPLPAALAIAILDARRTPIASDAAVMKTTSGSSGTPKATRTTEAELVADARHLMEGMRVGPDDTQLAVIPLSHSYGFSSLVTPLLLQGTPVVLRDSFVPAHVAADARRFDARVFPGVPFMFRSLLDEPPADGWPASLRTLISAGAPLPAETAHGFYAAFGVRIRSFYGTSETGGIAFDDDDAAMEPGETIGRPLPGVAITLRPEADLPAGVGRIFVRGDAVCSGYAAGGDDAFRAGGFLTGDYGRFDAAGRLVLTGRVSAFVNVGGKKVDPGEVERVLRSMLGIRDACVTAAADERRGEQVVACLVVDRPLSALAVRTYCAARLAPHKLPRTVLFVDCIPRTLRGKVDTQAVAALVAGAGRQTAASPEHERDSASPGQE